LIPSVAAYVIKRFSTPENRQLPLLELLHEEWRFSPVMNQETHPERDTLREKVRCVCDEQVKQFFYLTNTVNGNVLLFGNKCSVRLRLILTESLRETQELNLNGFDDIEDPEDLEGEF
jgi:hypothetical protein